jgi:hypothetical protein
VAKAAGLSSQIRLKAEAQITATFRYSTTAPLPPWRSTLAATGDHSDPSERFAKVAASPSRIATIALRLCESITTITTTTKTMV